METLWIINAERKMAYEILSFTLLDVFQLG